MCLKIVNKFGNSIYVFGVYGYKSSVVSTCSTLERV